MVHPILKPVTALGRSENNDVVIKEDSISREHAVIRYEDSEFIIHDLNSSNGTFINRRQIGSKVLKPGTLFYLAEVAIVFVKDDKKVTDSLQKDTGELKIDTGQMKY
jgi:pSer/pThr/pTyr-binding forkhead associated (FHA) protein